MKGGLVTALFTIKGLLEAGWDESEFTFLICGDEELSHPHTNAVENFKKYALGQDVCFCMEPGRENGAVVTGRKGAARPLIKVKGIASHANNAVPVGLFCHRGYHHIKGVQDRQCVHEFDGYARCAVQILQEQDCCRF